jgi:soluble lytic murein transglycosylase
MPKPKATRRNLCILLAVLLACAALLAPWFRRQALLLNYPQKYREMVEQQAETYGLDPLLVYAFIRTESGFDPNAESSVGARGLMQITQVTFDWIKSQIAADESVAFSDLYDPATNIRFGCYYLKRCLERYAGDIPTAAAAYHSGWGTVDTLLANTAYSQDGSVLCVFPYAQMKNYVAKIGSAYGKYQLLYRPEGV